MNRYFLILLFACYWLTPHAATQQFSDRIPGNVLAVGSSLDVYDHEFVEMSNNALWGNLFYNKKVSGKVTVGYEPDGFPSADVDHVVSLQIDLWTWNPGTASFVHTTVTKNLNLKFRADGHALTDDLSTYVFENAHRVKVKVLSVTGANAGNIYVESVIDVERYYAMPAGAVSNAGYRTDGGYLELYWDPFAGAESYELEWTFVSDRDYNIAAGTGITVPASNLSYDFYKNSTRIDVKSSYYRIPAIFNRGYVIWRVRAVGRQGNAYQYRKEGAWTLAESGTVNTVTTGQIYISSDYEAGKNWQHQVSYTEDGKRFESVSFADGFGRGRQSVSHNTETEQAVVSNVYYDRIGRPVVSDLPTPVDDEALKHYPDFNHGIDLSTSLEAPYGYQHYDYDVTDVCQPATNPFATSRGAGQYYSADNPNQEGFNASIPNAGGYPFAQVQYMNDQTGRIRRTGGYGPEHQLSAHHTEFFYGTPLQEELNRLFGTEAGLNEHYTYTVTMDANGQAYVSYYDMAGRVVASFLAGDAPEGVDALENNSGGAVVTNVIYDGVSDQLEAPGLVTYSRPFMAFSDASYTIEHTFTPSEYTSLCLPEDFCYDCFYDLELTVTDPECGITYYSRTLDSINGWSIDGSCNGAGYEGTLAEIALEKGQYMISKTLRVSEGAAEAYWCHYIANSTCAPDYASLYQTAYDATDFGCVDQPSAGTPDNTCDAYRSLLASDMSPGGQYGLPYDALNPGAFMLSIYNTSNTLPNGGDWRHPDGHYKDGTGNDVHIYISGSPGAYTPAVNPGATIQTDAEGHPYIYPEDLANLADFQQYWRRSWADALVKYHPEYCYLQFCEENTDFHTYNDALEAENTYDGACATGLMNPLNSGIFPSPNPMHYFQGCDITGGGDTFFTSTAWHDLENLFSPTASYNIAPLEDTLDVFFYYGNRKNQPLSLWEYAVWQVHCSDPALTYAQVKDCIKDAELTACDKDLVWRIFRDEYLKLRNEYYLIAQTMYVSYPNTLAGGGCGPAYNGCIGDAGYDPSDELKYHIRPDTHVSATGATTSISNTSGPCATTTAASYADKEPRFGNLLPYGYTYPGVTMDPTGIQDFIDDQVEAACAATCEAYADGWMEKLSGCDLTTTEYTEIRAALIDVCKSGCSAKNPGGATTADPTLTGLTYHSFGEVLANLAPHYQSAVCSEYLISEPRPFGQNEMQAAAEQQLESCGCDKLLGAEKDFDDRKLANNLPANVTTVEEMLAWREGIEIGDVSQFLCACRKAFPAWKPGAVWGSTQLAALAAADIPAPETLGCEDCVTCSAVQDLAEDFAELFEAEENLASHENYDVLYTNYLNQHLGYHLTAEDYESFLEGCSAGPEDNSCNTTGAGRIFKNLLNVIARQGELTTTSSYDLATSNIVYQYSNLSTLLGSTYTTCGGGCAPGTLTMTFGSAPDEKEAEFHLPEGADFGFADIIGITDITALSGCSGDNIDLAVRVILCGEIVTRHITGYSDDLGLVHCRCGETENLLCDEMPYVSPDPCWALELEVLDNLTEALFEEQTASQHTAFIADYTEQCSKAFQSEKLTLTGPENFYQFTLFYYDQAGNLVKTVAPKGAVNSAFLSSPDFADVDADRLSETPNFPDQEYATRYWYNSYSQVVKTANPDQDGATVFFYDRFGRIAASQNPVQADEDLYSYTLYDVQGRPVETGQVETTTALTSTVLLDYDPNTTFRAWVTAGTRTEVNYTQYDAPLSATVEGRFSGGQQNLRLRVASVLYFDDVDGSTDYTMDYASAIHYSYDQHGNVTEQLQDVPGAAVLAQDIKTRYDFELISGNVKTVKYQEGERDQLTHRYEYDLLNRLRSVYTSTDGVHESRDAKYRYYDYGPLARTETGQHQVQGMDYVYTINGWIKGMNGSTLQADRDLGRDGVKLCGASNTAEREYFARDVAGYTLGYFSGDYQGIGSPVFEASLSSSPVNNFATAQHDLYNGNISHLVTAITGYAVQGTAYRYDQLQRLKEMRVFRAADLVKNNSWKGAAETQEYYNSYSYDENGNILSLKRNGTTATGLLMDQFAYHYTSLGTNPSNRLDYVSDTGADDGTSTAGDIKDMPGSNYAYDKIGALLSDASEGIDEIEWFRGSKKVKRIVRSDADSPEVSFVYNPFGVRIVKVEKPRTGGVLSSPDQWKYTYYTYDANGQNMAVYETQNTADLNVTLKEQAIYGAGRIGLVQQDKLIHSATTTITDPTEIFTNTLGLKNYEITNYLGNVNAVITDRKVKALQTPTITDQVGISVSGGTITRTLSGTGWNAGGASSDQIWQGGGLEWTLGGTMADNQLIMLGLSYTNPNASNASIKYAWYTYTSGYPYIVESGTSVTFFPTTLVAGDKLKITRECGEIRYYVNGVLKRSVTDPQPLDPMIVDFSMNVSGKIIYDLKVQRDAGYEAVVVMKADYYPFGMQMPGRYEESGSYRYGYNGMEKDDEVKGAGNSYTTEFRQYDPRLGRWLSLDPLMAQFPWMSPFVGFDNNPIVYIDPLGLEATGDGWTKKEAKEYRKENNINGKLVKQKDGSWEIRTKDVQSGTNDYSTVISSSNIRKATPDEMLKNESSTIGLDKKRGSMTEMNVNFKPNSKIKMLSEGTWWDKLKSVFGFNRTYTADTGVELEIDGQGYPVQKTLGGVGPDMSKFSSGGMKLFKALLKTAKNPKQIVNSIKKLHRLKPKGYGSTGRTTPNNLLEQMVMESALEDPTRGVRIMNTAMSDARWAGWYKMEYKVKTAEGVNGIVHYVAKFDANGVMIAVDDFKFK